MVALQLLDMKKHKPSLDIKLSWDEYFKLKTDSELLNDLKINGKYEKNSSLIAGFKSVLKQLRAQIEKCRAKYGVLSEV